MESRWSYDRKNVVPEILSILAKHNVPIILISRVLRDTERAAKWQRVQEISHPSYSPIALEDACGDDEDEDEDEY